MINVEKIENKYLIALQALQDIMAEVNRNVLREDFDSYLKKILAWAAYDEVVYFLREFKNLPIEGEIKDIFISNDAEIGPKSLWFFLDGYCLEVKNILEKGKTLQDMQMTALKGEAEWVNIKKQNFHIETESSSPDDQLPSKLQISVKLDQILHLSAVNVPNCVHLLKIYREILEAGVSDLDRCFLALPPCVRGLLNQPQPLVFS
jgi:hypothetical protein